MQRAASRKCGSARCTLARFPAVPRIDLSGKTAIVTGASSGFGRATARALAGERVRVAGGARRVERLDTEIALELDVRDPESSTRFVEAAVERLGGIDILVNNARSEERRVGK